MGGGGWGRERRPLGPSHPTPLPPYPLPLALAFSKTVALAPSAHPNPNLQGEDGAAPAEELAKIEVTHVGRHAADAHARLARCTGSGFGVRGSGFGVRGSGFGLGLS